MMANEIETAADQLARALGALYEQAGNPTYNTLVRHGRGRSPAIAFTPQSLSDWRNGHSVPSSELDFRVLVQILELLAVQRDSEFRRQPAAAWDALRAAAWRERRSNPGGRPRNETGRGTQKAAAPSGAPDQTGPAERFDHEPVGMDVHLYGAQGVQFGDGNTQHNTFS